MEHRLQIILKIYVYKILGHGVLYESLIHDFWSQFYFNNLDDKKGTKNIKNSS